MLQGAFNKRLITITSVTAFFLFFASSVYAGISWQTGYIDKPYQLLASSLKIADDGTDYIAFGGDNLMLAKRSPGGQWVIKAVDTASSAKVGNNPSLALDSNGYPHISYYDDTNANLKYASFNGTTWAVEVVDVFTRTGSRVGSFSSLALDSSGNPCISYFGDHKILYASFNGSSWDIVNIFDTGTRDAPYNSLALDSAGNPHISYYESDSMDLGYSYYTGSAWVHQLVDTGGDVGEYNSLALDSTGKAHISYYDRTNTALKYASWSGTAWNILTLVSTGSVGKYSSLVLDSNDKYRISYYNQTNTNLWVLTQGSLIILQVNNEGGRYASLALDSSDKMRISYYIDGTGELKLSTRDTSWTTETVAVSGSTKISKRSLALDPSGSPGVAYINEITYDIMYASFNGSDWDIKTVASSSSIRYRSPSLAFRSNGNPTICYNDSTNGDLKLATWSGSSWSIITVDATGSVGEYCSIALDSNDIPHISYQEWIDISNQRIKYAYWNNSTWNTEVITPPGVKASVSIINLTSTDNPLIAYHDETYSPTNGSYMIATKTDTGWAYLSAQTTKKDPFIPSFSMILNSDDDYHLSYYNSSSSVLTNVFKSAVPGGDTSKSIVSLKSHSTPSLALDIYDHPAVSYYDYDNNQLKYAYSTGNNWIIQNVFLNPFDSYMTNNVAIDSNNKIWIIHETTKGDLKFAVGTIGFPWPMVLPAIMSNIP